MSQGVGPVREDVNTYLVLKIEAADNPSDDTCSVSTAVIAIDWCEPYKPCLQLPVRWCQWIYVDPVCGD